MTRGITLEKIEMVFKSFSGDLLIIPKKHTKIQGAGSNSILCILLTTEKISLSGFYKGYNSSKKDIFSFVFKS